MRYRIKIFFLSKLFVIKIINKNKLFLFLKFFNKFIVIKLNIKLLRKI